MYIKNILLPLGNIFCFLYFVILWLLHSIFHLLVLNHEFVIEIGRFPKSHQHKKVSSIPRLHISNLVFCRIRAPAIDFYQKTRKIGVFCHFLHQILKIAWTSWFAINCIIFSNIINSLTQLHEIRQIVWNPFKIRDTNANNSFVWWDTNEIPQWVVQCLSGLFKT